MLRQFILISLATLAAAAVCQDASARFSYKAPAAPARQLFDGLSKASGVTLTTAGSVGDDVLVLNLSDVSLADAMKRIGDALHAEWRQEGSGYVLSRGSNMEATDRRVETATRVAEFSAGVGRVLQEQKKSGTFNEDSAKKLAAAQRKMMEDIERQSSGGMVRVTGDVGGVAQQTPSAHAIISLLSRMSSAQIAAIVSGNRNVFALNPTRMQRPMPNGAQQIIRKFVADAQMYRDAVQRNQPNVGGAGNRQIIVNGFGADGAGDGDPSLGIGYAFLINQPTLGNSGVSFSLLVADPNGRTLASGQYFLSPPPPAAAGQLAAPPASEKPIQLSALAKELAQALNLVTGNAGGGGARTVRAISVAVGTTPGSSFTFTSRGGEGQTPALSAELRERILNPDKYDPLSFAPGEAMSQAAEAKGRDLVAYLPDGSFGMLNQIAATGEPTPTRFLDTARGQAGLNVVEDGSWIVVSPKLPASARDRRVNRNALANALQSMERKGFLNLDDWASFAAKQTKAPRFNEIDDSYLKLINSPAAEEGLNQYSFSGGWQTLQFYASLSTGQRQSMLQNGRVPLGTLSQYQTGIVTDQVYNSFEGPTVRMARQDGPGNGFMGGLIDALSERTLLLPNGLPRNGFLNFNVRGGQIVQANSSARGGSKFMTAESLAFERIRSERPDLASFGGPANFDQFRMATQRTFVFEFVFTPQVSMTKSLEDNAPTNMPYGAYNGLPAGFRERVEQQVEQLRRSFGAGGGGGGVPPPALVRE